MISDTQTSTEKESFYAYIIKKKKTACSDLGVMIVIFEINK